MNKKNRLAGRFLPSRVFARWKWTVRFGLSALPLILFLGGGMVLYLTPNRYQSAAVFEYLGKRPPVEAAALLKSYNVTERAISSLDLTRREGIDKETLFRVISKVSATKVDARTGMIELRVTHTRKEIARDLAAELPKALETYEQSLAIAAINLRLEAAEKSVTEAGDEAATKRQALVRLISVRGAEAADPVSRLDLDAARADWDHAYRRVLDGRTQAADARRELAAPGNWVVIHSQPVISQSPVDKKPDKSLGAVILQALGAGLAFSLLAPYLLELAFPRRSRPVSPGKDAWSEAADDSELVGLPANG